MKEIKFRYRLKLISEDWGMYKEGDISTFYFNLNDPQNGLSRFSIDKRWNIISCDQFTGLQDKNKVDIYSDDILKNNEGVLFRVYQTIGGFAIKESVWKENLSDEVNTDILIFQPLVDAQTISYIKESCEVVGNIHENKELL